MENEFKNEKALIIEGSSYWINLDEWNFLKYWRKKQQTFLATFGNRACGLQDPPVTEEERKWFDEEYEKKYGNS